VTEAVLGVLFLKKIFIYQGHNSSRAKILDNFFYLKHITMYLNWKKKYVGQNDSFFVNKYVCSQNVIFFV
jgi:hypothetical protein